MKWNCPHCGTPIAVADHSLGSEWSFSRCYRCSGFSLVRAEDAQVIKAHSPKAVAVPAAPPTEDFKLSAQALKNLQALQERKTSARTEQNSSAGAVPKRPSFLAQDIQPPPPPKKKKPAALVAERSADQSTATKIPDLPEPLPSTPKKNWIVRWAQQLLPFTGAAAVLAAGGLYIQLQEPDSMPAPQIAQAPAPQNIQTPPRPPQSAGATAAIEPGSDQLNQAAAAPVAPAAFEVKVKINRAILRSAPTTESNPLGYAELGAALKAIDFKDNWIQVQVPTSQLKAWIRNDLIQRSN